MPSREEADRILSARRKRKACYPCRQRKVRCNGVWPCATCIQRGHPEICIVDGGTGRTARRSDSAGSATHYNHGARQHEPNEHPGHTGYDDVIHEDASDLPPADHNHELEHQVPPSIATPCDPIEAQVDEVPYVSFVGTNSTPSFVHGSPLAGDTELEREVRPALGLQNTLKSYPFMRPDSLVNLPKELNLLIPTHTDILKYSQHYQATVYPFYPLVADDDDLESLICFYLERASIRDSSGVSIFDNDIKQEDVAKASLLLAILASGTQFSELATADRIQLSREFTRRSFHCGRLANFLVRPTADMIQALLILGHVLQNDGQADAAWALLGTTTRLGQSLGLHATSRSSNPSLTQKKRARLWSVILWQDCVLSLSFDRPIVSSVGHGEHYILPDETHIDYVGCMFELTMIGRAFLGRPHTERAQSDVALHHLHMLDKIKTKWYMYTEERSNHRSRQARMEEHVLCLHISFFTSVVCRGFLKLRRPSGSDAEHDVLCMKGRMSLLETMQAFLSLQSLSVLPLRSWSMIHAGLSAALLFELFGPSKNPTPGSENLQMRFINALSSINPAGDSNTEMDKQPLLSASHMKAMRALRHTIIKRQSQQAIQTSPGHGLSPGRVEDGSRNHGVWPGSQEGNAIFNHSALLQAPLNPAGNLVNNVEALQGNEEFSDLPFDTFGNIDWGNGFFENGFDFNDSLDQLQWGL